MNLLFRILYAQKCSSTHHKLALDALRYLRNPQAEEWSRLFLAEIELYLDGSKAPDRKFKDFRNHVLHVSEGNWGGAAAACEQWYERLRQQLQAEDWKRAVYCAGVLTHYLSDPLMPLHTGQTEDEAQVHKFIEWGTTRIYRDLVETHDAARALQNWRPQALQQDRLCGTTESVDGSWLTSLVIEGAQVAHRHYDVMIDHYDPLLARDNPAKGFGDQCRSSLATVLGWSIRLLAYVIDRAILESGAAAPRRALTVSTVLSGISTPIFWLTRNLADQADRRTVRAIYDELQQSGRVVDTLPEDDRTIRECHATEVLRTSVEELCSIPIRKAGSGRIGEVATEPDDRETEPRVKSTAQRYYLRQDSPVVDAPSIGPRTAVRLHKIGIFRVDQLLSADAVDAVEKLDQRWITEAVFQAWQLQSALMCSVAGLRGHDVQILVEVGITNVDDLRSADADSLLQLTQELAATSEGQRILRSSDPPDAAEVAQWIAFAQQVSQPSETRAA